MCLQAGFLDQTTRINGISAAFSKATMLPHPKIVPDRIAPSLHLSTVSPEYEMLYTVHCIKSACTRHTVGRDKNVSGLCNTEASDGVTTRNGLCHGCR